MYKSKKILIFLIAILLFFCGCTSSLIYTNKKVPKNILKVHFIDVGQGDSTLLQFNNKNILIDSGPNSSLKSLNKYLKTLHIKKLDCIIATHPHEDHIGNMENLINSFKVGSFYAPKILSNTNYFYNMVNALKKNNLKIHIAKNDVSLNFDSKLKCEFLAPNSLKYDNLNNYSAVLKVTYNKCSFLFMGDAETLSEKEILDKKYDIYSQVIKIGHHGSSTSTSKNFLKKVSPKVAIISCGKHNVFRHPSKTTLKKLNNFGVKTYRTDIDGTVVLICDGHFISKMY